ncbi:uroporphyrinogen decarboxylase family protein [Treponema primitia]|uniref:uroporphyrinogen decarboxylase family protein n=1 Tax=Treponema primitia TaxID=88058 RepID=UPI00025553C6|nr:uroporphyrinogen decarboxylase family protein [Treponema primitia]
MGSREYVLQSLNHKQPEKLPLDLGGTPSSGISAIGYNKLKKALGINDRSCKIYDVVQQVAQPELNVLDAIHGDTLCLGRAFNDKPEDWYDVTLADGSLGQYPVWFKPTKAEKGGYNYYDEEGDYLARMPEGGTFFDQTYFPYIDAYPADYKDIAKAMNKVLWQKLAHSPWDNAGMPDFWGELRRRALKLRESSDRAIVITCGCNLFEWGTFLRKMDNFLVDIYTEEDDVIRLLDVLMEIHLQSLEKVCNAVGDIVDILRFGDDLGMTTGMFMSQEKYQTIFKPRHTKLCEYVHKHSTMKTFLHSCGSIYPIMGDLIEAGYDIINPVQTTAKQMDPVALKKEFGKDIVFWGGGCNTQSVLNQGTPQEVYDHTRKMIDIFFQDGGFVFNTVHNVLPDVPEENMLALYRAVGEYK